MSTIVTLMVCHFDFFLPRLKGAFTETT